MSHRWHVLLIGLALFCTMLVYAWAVANSPKIRQDCVRFVEQRGFDGNCGP